MNVMRQNSIRFSGSVLAACGLVLAFFGCTDGRNATTPGELYHCDSSADCLSGWACECGYCQQPGVTQFACGVTAGDTTGDGSLSSDTGDSAVGDATGSDAEPGDTAGTDATADSGATDATGDTGGPPVGTPLGICNQAVSSDVVFAACNLTDWTGCAAGFGCYYGPAIKQTLCKKHASLAEGATCDPCNLTECGLAADSHVLICDAPTKTCRRTCDATVVGTGVKPGQCPAAQQCYQLVDANNVPYPSQGGICAP